MTWLAHWSEGYLTSIRRQAGFTVLQEGSCTSSAPYLPAVPHPASLPSPSTVYESPCLCLLSQVENPDCKHDGTEGKRRKPALRNVRTPRCNVAGPAGLQAQDHHGSESTT
ncbi:hypothetical protein AAFF_G00301160 [Aldrovandia affinis]|uniref:Uncharacterized protein n=1 Tax=Aldrovandia affinis TaxID=143900 RepID=A0AAD7WRG0_9TELE|nr:hypothetical protein AAFF_G00301160 [Aldrovandia affinis]